MGIWFCDKEDILTFSLYKNVSIMIDLSESSIFNTNHKSKSQVSLRKQPQDGATRHPLLHLQFIIIGPETNWASS